MWCNPLPANKKMKEVKNLSTNFNYAKICCNMKPKYISFEEQLLVHDFIFIKPLPRWRLFEAEMFLFQYYNSSLYNIIKTYQRMSWVYIVLVNKSPLNQRTLPNNWEQLQAPYICLPWNQLPSMLLRVPRENTNHLRT